jgi:hypothetical protein
LTRADIRVCDINPAHVSGAGTQYVVNTPSNGIYIVFIDRATIDVYWTKSTDGGLSWTDAVVVRTGSVVALSVWYDRSSGINADLVHIAYVDANNIFYRSLDAASGTLGTETTVFTGVSSAAGGALTIWRERNGDLRVAGSIDAGAEDGAWSSTDAGATWGDTIADPSEGATQDQYFGLPGFNNDTADGMLIFVDASTNGLSVKRYDDSANTWGETAIIADGSFTDNVATNQFANVACVVDLTNSRNIVAAWTGTDTANVDLRLFFITDTTHTESAANVVLNSVDDQGMCAVALDTNTGYIYVFYFGKSDGSETWAGSVNLYYRFTTDDGATWSAETLLSRELHGTNWLICTPRFAGANQFVVAFSSLAPTDDFLMVSVQVPMSASIFGGELVR